MKARLRYAKWWLLMTLHEFRCSRTSDYNVYNGDLGCIVIHDQCGKVWSTQ